jgi:hypothetical protein
MFHHVTRRSLLLAGLALPSLGFFDSLASMAFGEKRSRSEEQDVNRCTTHFVAVNGNDDGPGTADHPWATINHAAEHAKAGDTIVIRGGHYILSTQIRPRHSGRPDAWITFIGYPGEEPILDAQKLPRSTFTPGGLDSTSTPKGLDNGVFQIEGPSHIRVARLTVINSQGAGFTVRDSSNIDLTNNSTKGTFSSGIAVWDTNHYGKATKHIRIIGNTITRATTWDLAPSNMSKRGEAPQEALSIAGAVDFEVSYNHIYDSDKEGIDIKETSKRGKVHHNLIHNLDRQGIYVDAWFGKIRNIEIFSNVIHHCRTAGIAISVENGQAVENIKIRNNLIFDNLGSGLYISRWGANGPRQNIQILNNTFYHNGYGQPAAGQTYYWMTGGLYLYTVNVRNISIKNNIFSDNCGFQIGYSELFVENKRSWQGVAREQGIQITANLIDGRNIIDSPIRSGGYPRDRVNIYAVNGHRAIFGSPLFKDPANQDFTLRRESPAALNHIAAGAYAPGSATQLWWKQHFPPQFTHVSIDKICEGQN